jgi:hypothetical protein
VLPELWYEAVSDDFTHPTAQAIHRAITAAGGVGVDLAAVLDAADDDDIRGVIREVALEDDDQLDADDPAVLEQYAGDIVRNLLLPRVRADIARATEELARRSPDADDFVAVQQRVKELNERLHGLQPARD